MRRAWFKLQAERVVRTFGHHYKPEGMSLQQILSRILSGTGDRSDECVPSDHLLCTVESVLRELESEGIVEKVFERTWPDIRYQDVGLLDALARASR